MSTPDTSIPITVRELIAQTEFKTPQQVHAAIKKGLPVASRGPIRITLAAAQEWFHQKSAAAANAAANASRRNHRRRSNTVADPKKVRASTQQLLLNRVVVWDRQTDSGWAVLRINKVELAADLATLLPFTASAKPHPLDLTPAVWSHLIEQAATGKIYFMTPVQVVQLLLAQLHRAQAVKPSAVQRLWLETLTTLLTKTVEAL